jgi:hypothetical protein
MSMMTLLRIRGAHILEQVVLPAHYLGEPVHCHVLHNWCGQAR